jgi:hypothetical protein
MYVTKDAINITKITAALIPRALEVFFDTPTNGHTPKNRMRTILLISIEEMMAVKKTV